MPRSVDDCEFRHVEKSRLGRERASCGLVEGFFPGRDGAGLRDRSACEQCCRSAPPGSNQLNDVVASEVYRRGARILAASPPDSALAEKARVAMAEAMPALRFDRSSTPNHPWWTGDVPELGSIPDLIDRSVTPETLARHLLDDLPFAYVRYNDGEWLSILGQVGRNGDGHDFMPDTVGLALRHSLEYASKRGSPGDRYYAGLHAIDFQPAIRRYLVEHSLAHGPRWVQDNLFGLGLLDLSTLRFLRAVHAFRGPKVLVANQDLAPVARGLGARHVVIPRVDCHHEYPRILREARFRGKGLVITCAAMTAKILIAQLHHENPFGSYADCGHIFDAIVGKYTRDYTQGDWGGIREFLAEHYAPVVLGSMASRETSG